MTTTQEGRTLTEVETRSAESVERQSGHLENVALFLGAGGLVVGVTVGLVVLKDFTAFQGSGWVNVSSISDIASGIVAGVVFVVTWLWFVHPSWYRGAGVLRRAVHTVGLTLLVGSLTFFLMRAFNRVIDAAFIGLRFDVWSGTAFIALACGVSAYFAASVAARLTLESLSVVVSAFLVMGAMMSAVNTSDQFWWQVHFSSLGMAPGLAGFTFNYTLILTGVVIATIADFLAYDMRSWLDVTDQGRWKSRVVSVGLMVMGIALGGIGLIPVNLSHAGHLFTTYVAVGAFFALALVAPVILRGIPWGFRVASLLIVVFVALLAYLFKGVRYLGTTGFEMLAVSTVLVWMVLFIRTMAAVSRDAPKEAEATSEKSTERTPEGNLVAPRRVFSI